MSKTPILMLNLGNIANMLGIRYGVVKNWPDKKCFDFPWYSQCATFQHPQGGRPQLLFNEAHVLAWIEKKKKERQYIIDELISLTEAAKELGVHPSTLSSYIHRRKDCPPVEIIKTPYFPKKFVWFNREQFMVFVDCYKRGEICRPYIRNISPKQRNKTEAYPDDAIDNNLARAFICRR